MALSMAAMISALGSTSAFGAAWITGAAWGIAGAALTVFANMVSGISGSVTIPAIPVAHGGKSFVMTVGTEFTSGAITSNWSFGVMLKEDTLATADGIGTFGFVALDLLVIAALILSMYSYAASRFVLNNCNCSGFLNMVPTVNLGSQYVVP